MCSKELKKHNFKQIQSSFPNAGDICVIVIEGQTLEVQVVPLPARRLAGGVRCM